MRKLYRFCAGLIIALCVLCVAAPEASASHFAAWNITYKRDSSNLTINKYTLLLTIYYDCSGVSPSSTEYVYYKNAGQTSSSNSIACNEISNTVVDPPCLNPQGPGPCSSPPGTAIQFREVIYEGTVTFPTTSANLPANRWQMWWTSCCRNAAIDNLDNPSGLGSYCDAYLDLNISPPNNSPIFTEKPVPYRCVNTPVVISQGVADQDVVSDSIYFQLIQARQGGTYPGTLITYVLGYNYLIPQPVGAAPIISQTNGDIFLTATLPNPPQFVAVFALRATEYRNGDMIGWVMRDLQVVFKALGQCDTTPLSFAGVTPGTGGSNIPDTIFQNCLDTVIAVAFNNPFRCESVSLDGSDFRVVEANTSQNIPISAAIGLNCTATTASSSVVIINLAAPLATNGIYYIFTKRGNDGDVLLTDCGIEMPEFDTVALLINNCYEYNLPLDVTNVTVNEDNNTIDIVWKDNPIPPDTAYFRRYEVYRIDTLGGTAEYVGYSNQFWNKRFNHLDTTTGSTLIAVNDVMVQPSLYHVRTVLISEFGTVFSDSVASIHLKLDPADADSVNSVSLRFTKYWGWLNPTYEVQESTAETGAPWVTTSTVPAGQLNFEYPKNQGTPNLPTFVRVLTKFTPTSAIPGDSTSISNVVTYTFVPEPPDTPPVPPQPIIVYNVISPNGDLLNEKFVITNIGDHPNSKLFIFNRWGQEVYRNDSYDNSFDGEGLADGEYYYMLENKADVMVGELRGYLRIQR